jgi:hypothetical protein
MENSGDQGSMNKRRENGLHVLTRSLPDHEEFFVTASALDGETPGATLARAAGALEGTGATILTQEIFGAEHDDGALIEAFGEPAWPVTRVLTTISSGTQLWAATGVEVERIRQGSRVIGSVWSDRHARYCRLGDLGPLSLEEEKPAQVTETFERMEQLLGGVGMGFPDLARTWLYLDRILDWYGDFNAARDAFFRPRGIFDGLVPASTGMAGSNPEGSALMTGLIAVRSEGGEAKLEMVPSPLQCPALEYGSSFSRALEVRTPDLRRLYVSGTASIGSNGLEIVHQGDVDAQVARTVEVITAIIESRGLSWDDATRAIAYFKHAKDVNCWESNRVQLGLPDLPVLVVQNDVCFSELLFELEVDVLA